MKTFFVAVLRKKKRAVYIEVLMKPASPNQSDKTKKIAIQNKSPNTSNLEISEQANPSPTNVKKNPNRVYSPVAQLAKMSEPNTCYVPYFLI